MAKFAIVIEDVKKAHAGELARGFRSAARPKGFVHTEADDTCPLGRPNCRNCGDPDHVAECQAAGHCPDCGTKHGIAPDAIVARNGYRLEPR